MAGYWNWEDGPAFAGSAPSSEPQVGRSALRPGRKGLALQPPHWSHQQITDGDDYRRWKQEHRRN